MALGERQSIANKISSEQSREMRFDKTRALAQEDVPVCVHAIYKQCICVAKTFVSDQRTIRPFAGPMTEQVGRPRRCKDLQALSDEEDVVL
jgi:hypothetical protein